MKTFIAIGNVYVNLQVGINT